MSELDEPAPVTETATRLKVLEAASRRGRQVHQSTDVRRLRRGRPGHLRDRAPADRLDRRADRLDRRQGNDSQDAALAALAETVYGECCCGSPPSAWPRSRCGRSSRRSGAGRRRRAGSTRRSAGSVRCSARSAYLTLGISAARVALVGHAARNGRRTVETSTAAEEIVLRVLAVIDRGRADRGRGPGDLPRHPAPLRRRPEGLRVDEGDHPRAGRLHRQGHHLRASSGR